MRWPRRKLAGRGAAPPPAAELLTHVSAHAMGAASAHRFMIEPCSAASTFRGGSCHGLWFSPPSSFLEAAHGLNRNIANNVFALLVVGAVALVVAGILTWRNERTRPALVGYTAALFIWIATALVFALARHFFAGHAHYTAAVLMFGCILIVALNNAFGYKWKGRGESLKNRYMAIAVAMVASAVGVGLAGLLGWRYWTIAIETALITLFAVFWAVQTRELWRPGQRVEGGR